MGYELGTFHPLDHRAFTSECRSYYGGGTHHLRLWWVAEGRAKVRRNTLCKIGRHQIRGGDVVVLFWPFRSDRVCINCLYKPPGEVEDEQVWEQAAKYCSCGHEMEFHHPTDTERTFWSQRGVRGRRTRKTDMYRCRVDGCDCVMWDYAPLSD